MKSLFRVFHISLTEPEKNKEHLGSLLCLPRAWFLLFICGERRAGGGRGDCVLVSLLWGVCFFVFWGFWPSCVACGILVPDRDPVPFALPVVETWSLNHWTSREIPELSFAIMLTLSCFIFSRGLVAVNSEAVSPSSTGMVVHCWAHTGGVFQLSS